ncbi:Rieske 2Fe-2S domain-containing protein [Ruegeria arenilitoris]|uniref:Rieske 2Fe-2S domain-containing protein n=1 Tax=Ruegeria arenilitoris TaxID=1173585 RepID=UPI0014814ED0|nr:Rieske 2Fe-2S domain-containing protein [Ruegeria arenilitoris]
MTADLWHAVARSRDLRRKPIRVRFGGKPVALFRNGTGVSALHDQCPHRLVPLSDGRVVGDTIECPYHGWRFSGDGTCVDMPGTVEALPRCRVPRYRVLEAEGGIFLSSGQPPAPPVIHPLQGQDIVSQVVKSTTRSTLVDVAENILDATHTHYTHKGLLRGLSAKRYRVQVEVTRGPDWVEAVYTGEERQHGLVSALLDGSRTKGVGRYRRPGIAELEYWGPRGMVLATTFHLRQTDAETVEGIGWLSAPRQHGLGHLKALFFKPMFRVALEQDRRVLASALENGRGSTRMIGPLDILRREIELIEAGQTLTPGVQHYEMEI